MIKSSARPLILSVDGYTLARTDVHPSWEFDEIFEILEPPESQPRYVRVGTSDVRTHRDRTSDAVPISCPCVCLRSTFFAPATGWVQPWTVMIGDRRWASFRLPLVFGFAAETSMSRIEWVKDAREGRQVLLRRRGDALTSRPVRERVMQLPSRDYRVELFSEERWERTVDVIGGQELFELLDDSRPDGHLISGFHDATGWAPW